MMVQECGGYFSLQLLTKCNLAKACSAVAEGANLVCLMKDACCRKRVETIINFALRATLIFWREGGFPQVDFPRYVVVGERERCMGRSDLWGGRFP